MSVHRIVLSLTLLLVPLAAYAVDISEIDLASVKGPDVVNIFLPQMKGWEHEFAYEDEHVKSVLEQDTTMAFRYMKDGDRSKVVWVSIQISKGKHVWEDSLLYAPAKRGQPQATVIEHKDVTLNADPQISAKFFVYQRPNSTATEAVLYWFEKVEFKIGNSFEERNVLVSLWQDASSLKKAGFVNDVANTGEIERFYLSFALPIAEHWQQIGREEVQTAVNPLWFLFLAAPALYFGIRTMKVRQNR
jgi:hypothetical protein